MTYQRVIPRDLFNEANLLKCLGKVYINLEKLNLPNVAFEFEPHPFEGFYIHQNQDDGSIYASNVILTIGEGDPYTNCIERHFTRPLNSREPWPLYTVDMEQNEVPVFDDEGEFTPEFVAFLKAPPLQE